jgi:hypothetical protein
MRIASLLRTPVLSAGMVGAVLLTASGTVSAITPVTPGFLIQETRFLSIPENYLFDRLGDLAGAIDPGGSATVGVHGVRGVWGLSTQSRFTTGFDPLLLDGIRVGVQWEIDGLRDLSVVTNVADAAQYGRSAGGAVTILSKVGSDSLDPVTSTRLGQIAPPGKLEVRLAPSLEASYGFQTGGSSGGAYLASSNTLVPLARLGGPVPERPGSKFISLSAQIGLSASSAVFSGTTDDAFPGGFRFSAIYRHDRTSGTVAPVVENEPVTDTFGVLGAVDLDSERMVFGSSKGIYWTDFSGAAFHEILPAGTEYAPGRSIANFSQLNLSGNRLAFTSFVLGGTAAFVTTLDGVLEKIADNQTPVPGGVGNFTFVQQVGISDDWIAFIGFDGTFTSGLFGYRDGTLFRIAGPGDVKDGKTVKLVDFQPDALDQNILAYTAYFTDNSAASYLVAIVPEPSSIFMLLVGVPVVAAAVGRARRKVR